MLPHTVAQFTNRIPVEFAFGHNTSICSEHDCSVQPRAGAFDLQNLNEPEHAVGRPSTRQLKLQSGLAGPSYCVIVRLGQQTLRIEQRAVYV
jgi:hypothetical protein